jgi:hypothetical protein
MFAILHALGMQPRFGQDAGLSPLGARIAQAPVIVPGFFFSSAGSPSNHCTVCIYLSYEHSFLSWALRGLMCFGTKKRAGEVNGDLKMSGAKTASRRRILPAAVVVIGWMILLMPEQAWAQFYVRQPEVEKGEIELEEHAAVYSGAGEVERLRQSHEVEFYYGLTDRWLLITEGFFEQPIGENLEATEFEIGGQYELVKRKGDGFDAAFRTIYEATKDEGDELLFGPIVKYVHGRDSTTLNTFFIGQLGDETEIDSLEFKYNWQLRHELNHRVAFGVEAFGEIEDLANPGSFNDQLHRAGPVIYLNFGQEADDAAIGKHEYEETEHEQDAEAPELKLAGGILFGLSNATSDVTFKFDAELEF